MRAVPVRKTYSHGPVWWVLQESRATGSTRLVLLVLAECAQHQKCISSLSISEIMRLTKLSRSQVFFHLRALLELGEIVQLGRHSKTTACVYHLPKFCESGSARGVRLAGFQCPHVQHFQRNRGPVRQAAYINTEAALPVRETGLDDVSAPSAVAVPNVGERTPEAGRSKTPKPKVVREWVEAYSTDYQLRWREYADGTCIPSYEPATDIRPSDLEGSPEERAQWLAQLVAQHPTLARLCVLAKVVAASGPVGRAREAKSDLSQIVQPIESSSDLHA